MLTEAQQDQDLKDRVAMCYADPVLFCKTYIPHWFGGNPPDSPEQPTIEIPWFQRGILAILTGRVEFLEYYGELDKIISNFITTRFEFNAITRENEEIITGAIFWLDSQGHIHMTLNENTVIMLPRGYAKTTTGGVAAPLYNTVYRNFDFTLYTSKAEEHASMQLDNIKRELDGNEVLKHDFGTFKPGLKDSERWSKLFFETKARDRETTGVAFAARGQGGSVRGLLHGAHRPDLVIVDDLEDKEDIDSETYRQKVRTWFNADLKPCRRKVGKKGKIIMLSTLLHADALPTHLMNDPEWSTVYMGAHDRENELLWEANMNDAALQNEKASMAAQGLLHIFWMEYYNKSVVPELQLFKPEYFVYGYQEESHGRLIGFAIAMDPASSEKRTADDTAIAVIGYTDRGFVVVLDLWGTKTADPDMQLNAFFGLIRKWGLCDNPCHFGIESISYQATLITACKRKMGETGIWFEIEPITHKVRKTARIKNILQPLYANRLMIHSRHFGNLEGQLQDFRENDSHDHDDYPDAVAMAVNLLDNLIVANVDGTLRETPALQSLDEILGDGDFEWVH
jgi:hypothetical protein